MSKTTTFSLLVFYCLITACSKNRIQPESQFDASLAPILSKIKDNQIPVITRIQLSDSLINTYKNKSIDSIYLFALWKKAGAYYSLKKYDSFFDHSKLLEIQAQKIGQHYFSGRANFNIGYYYDELAIQYDSAFYYYNKSRSDFIRSSDSVFVGRRYLEMAILQKNQNDFFGAKETAIKAIPFLEKLGEQRFLASVYNLLGSTNRKLEMYNEAIIYYKKAIQITQSKKDLLVFKNNLALVYKDLGEYKKTITILDFIFKDSNLVSGSIQYARVLDNLSFTQWKLGDKTALNGLNQSLSSRKKQNDQRGLIASYTHLSEYYSETAPLKAKAYLDSVIQLSKKLKIPKAETDALSLLMQLEPQNVRHKDRYIQLKDSLYKQEHKVKTQFAKMKYDYTQKESALLRLEAEQAQKEADLAGQRLQKVVFISLSGLLILTGSGLFFYLKRRNQKEKDHAIDQTEKEISRRLHDGLANDLYGIMVSAEQQIPEQSKYWVDDLEKAYNKTRDLSYELSLLDNSLDFEEQLGQMLLSFQNKDIRILTKHLKKTPWKKLGKKERITIYQALRELLVNMKKHAWASLVALTFKPIEDKLHIHYKDNGIGCDPGIGFGNGLQNTETRIRDLGGRFIFTASKGKGVEVTIEIPI
jgi:signal transduction histidine kinase